MDQHKTGIRRCRFKPIMRRPSAGGKASSVVTSAEVGPDDRWDPRLGDWAVRAFGDRAWRTSPVGSPSGHGSRCSSRAVVGGDRSGQYRRALGAVQVEDDPVRRPAPVRPVDPRVSKVWQGCEVGGRRQPLGFEAPPSGRRGRGLSSPYRLTRGALTWRRDQGAPGLWQASWHAAALSHKAKNGRCSPTNERYDLGGYLPSPAGCRRP
jgi:hypothetical protein